MSNSLETTQRLLEAAQPRPEDLFGSAAGRVRQVASRGYLAEAAQWNAVVDALRELTPNKRNNMNDLEKMDREELELEALREEVRGRRAHTAFLEAERRKADAETSTQCARASLIDSERYRTQAQTKVALADAELLELHKDKVKAETNSINENISSRQNASDSVK